MAEMKTRRRGLLGLGLGLGATAATLGLAGTRAMGAAAMQPSGTRPPPIGAAPPPIGAAERQMRLEKASERLAATGHGALLVEAGSTLSYLTGIDWWRSERLTAAVVAANGKVLIVTPGFEQPSIEEMLVVSADVRVWQEDEDPAALIAGWLDENGLSSRPLAIEPTVRFFAIQALRDIKRSIDIRNGAAIVNDLRMIKSPAEIALMQHAADITQAAYRAVGPQIRIGMTKSDIFALMQAEMAARGGETPSGGIEIGEGSALPHGSKKVETVAEGATILMDCGCRVDGYYADISRTMIFGEPSARQRQVWKQVRDGQSVAMEAAQIGRTAGSVDDAVRSFYEGLGWGPGYATPGLPHRTGHGIGLDIHEPVNLVHGEETLLRPGMCFSNEPGLYIPGEFGVRLEDCFYMTAEGPRFFTQPPPTIDDPFA